MTRQISEADRTISETGRGPRRRTGFFISISVVMLAIVSVGFAPTLYLRALFHVPPIPTYLYVHGALVTAWFVLVLAQVALMRGGKVATHRRLGMIGVLLGVAVVVASAVVTLRFAYRAMHTPTPGDVDLSVMLGFGLRTPLFDLAATALWGNLASVTTFAVLVGCAVLMRNRRDSQAFHVAGISVHPPPCDRACFTVAGTRR